MHKYNMNVSDSRAWHHVKFVDRKMLYLPHEVAYSKKRRKRRFFVRWTPCT